MRHTILENLVAYTFERSQLKAGGGNAQKHRFQKRRSKLSTSLYLFFAENIFILFYLFAIQNFNPHWKRSCHHLLLLSYQHGTLRTHATIMINYDHL